MAEAARAKGYSRLGFSSHAPLPFPNDWTMQPERLGAYVAEVRRLAAQWAVADPPLEIYLGLEIDWIEGLLSASDPAFDRIGLDYSIGSVHFVRLPGAGLFTVDEPAESFAANMRLLEGDANAVWREYYRNLSAMIAQGGFDIVGHFDIVRKNNAGGRYFDEDSPAYHAAALEAASLLAGKDLIVEINVGAMARGSMSSPYPSLPILRELRRRGVRITFSADAHAPEHLGLHLDAARALAVAAGYKEISVLGRGPTGAMGWTEIGIDET